MSRARDQRVLAGLIRKAQDTGIPAAEREAFRAKAEESHRRLAASGAAPAPANANSARPDAAPGETSAAGTAPGASTPKPQTRRPARKSRRWRPVHGVLACFVGLGLGLFVQSQPGPAMIIVGTGMAFGAIYAAWARRATSGKGRPAEATG